MTIDYQRINEFIGQSSTKSQIAAACRAAGFEISWVFSRGRDLWGFYLKPTRGLRDALGVHREVLLWVTEFPEFQARALSQAEEFIAADQPRLSDELAIVVTADPNTRKRVSEASEGLRLPIAGFSLADFDHLAPAGPRSFLLAIQHQFFAKDLYYVSNALLTRRSFFGRGSLIREILTTIRTGTSHLALFGLRKAGKTSLLYRLIDELSTVSSIHHVHIDLQRLDAIRPTAEYFLWSVGAQLFAGHVDVRAIGGFRLFDRVDRFPDDLSTEQVFEQFDHDIRLLLSRTTVRYLVMCDEIELMSPDTPGSNWGDAFVRVWRLLRGIDQTHTGRLRFLVAGTNPQCIESNMLNKKENPTYNYFMKKYLSPLSFPECEELLTTLGNHMGIKWEPIAARRAFKLVGGHPFLLRLLGSAMHRSKSPRDAEVSVSESDVVRRIPDFIAEMNSTLGQMVDVLGEYYKSEYHLLETLASGRLGEFRELAEAFPNDVAHLVGYGLIDKPESDHSLSVEILQAWLQQRLRPRSVVTNVNVNYERDSIVGCYRINEMLGKPGGFGTVYRAERQTDRLTVALKVIHDGSLAQLQREVDAVSSVRHPGIVEILDHGKLPDGNLFVAMEYLDGRTLSQHCTRATRLNSKDARKVLEELLSALVKFHPDKDVVDDLKRRASLTSVEYRLLSDAMHGYVHRDIKPDNVVVVEGRGAVLIDFGISVQVATSVKTMSGTKGYFPPDGIDAKWSADVDLYQLGLTMAQVMCGVQLEPDRVSELRLVQEAEPVGNIGKVILRLCAPNRRDRFESAREALRALNTAG
jgi:serine/threonine-protein kinase